MPPKPKHRDVAGFLSRVRDFFLGRTHKTALRFADTVSPRTQPPPDIPKGPSQSLFSNYYYTRDPRRLVKPSVDLVLEHKQMLAAKLKAEEAARAAQAKSRDAPMGGAPAAPPKDSDSEDCHQWQDSGAKRLPTPGQVHSWEGPR
ncbi:NADH dehydrogenase [ubiquinone] 1 alpha subcomplex subunit 7 [Drosophila biarmipes]|uniref:NADH dehydrogenase [ubiquinone] 1 alpha subcomplex subunit 7 n=1 Tax=Drosophila biarmipes TaxID=125945 RepID=UPI0007E7F623|nr:NADH dehydrogenase [ubiquinone] 1 alpha subcomplex subunit 7 [Drosophila biarmipes]